MRPFLLQFSNISIVAYPLFATLAFVISAIWAGYRAKNRKLDADLIPEVTFLLFISCFAGARLFSVIIDIHNGECSIFDIGLIIHKLLAGGLVANGGIIMGIIVFTLFFHLKKKNALTYANTFAPAMGLGVFLFRMGCFLSGCCFGKPSNSIIAISFPEYTPAGLFQRYMGAHGLFPSQLLEAVGGLIIMLVILLSEKFLNMKKNQFILFISGYGICRFLVDFTRYYPETEKFQNLTVHQWISIFYSLAGIMLILLYRKSRDVNK